MDDHLAKQGDVLAHGRGQHDEIGVGDGGQVVSRRVDGTPRQRLANDRLPIDGNHAGRRPRAASPKRNRPADQSEANNRDLREDGGIR